MAHRITLKDLEARISHLNHITGSPATPYTRHENGVTKANIGNYYLAAAYGGYQLEKIESEGGGCSHVFGCGFTTKAELYGLIGALIRGFELTKFKQ